MKPVPNKARPIRVFSPNRIPNTSVAAKVVALVMGTAREIGALLKRAKKVADADTVSFHLRKKTMKQDEERKQFTFLGVLQSTTKYYYMPLFFLSGC